MVEWLLFTYGKAHSKPVLSPLVVGNGEGAAGAGSNYFVILTGQATGASVDAKSKLSTTWANIKSN